MKIADFLLFNDNGAVLDSILWESFKVVLRGHIISFQPSAKSARMSCLANIEAKLSVLEESYCVDNSGDTLNEMLSIKYGYSGILGEQVGNYIRKLKQKHFELGDKPDRLLTRQLKGVQADRAIHKISTMTGVLITNQKRINFLDFYSQLYTSKSTATDAVIKGFLHSLNIPSLSEVAMRDLDSDITLEEIKIAICSFPNCKACGPDGFAIEFYKAHIDSVAPHVNSFHKNWHLP